MSGIMKSVKKVFKKVGKTVKKVAPYALAAGAIYFSAGALMPSLGLPGTAGIGGWGGASAKAMNSLFGKGLLADTLSGAMTQAGYGALIGGGVSAVTGGDITEGMGMGAAAGALTGGVTGFAGSGSTLAAPGAVRGPAIGGAPLPPGPPLSLAPPIAAPTASIAPGPVATGGVTPTPSVTRTGLLGFWDEVKNSELASGIAGGVVKGLGGALLADDATDTSGYGRAAEINAAAAAEARRAAYIGSDQGLLTQANTVSQVPRPTPAQRWDTPTPALQGA